jgi:hypothetical protein
MIIGVIERRAMSDEHRAILERVLKSGSTTTQSLASFRAQARAELYLSCGELERALEAIRDADANGLLDVLWLDRCPVLDEVRARGDLEAVRRSTALRATRVSDALHGPSRANQKRRGAIQKAPAQRLAPRAHAPTH